jgi:hypothetical protein
MLKTSSSNKAFLIEKRPQNVICVYVRDFNLISPLQKNKKLMLKKKFATTRHGQWWHMLATSPSLPSRFR